MEFCIELETELRFLSLNLEIELLSQPACGG